MTKFKVGDRVKLIVPNNEKSLIGTIQKIALENPTMYEVKFDNIQVEFLCGESVLELNMHPIQVHEFVNDPNSIFCLICRNHAQNAVHIKYLMDKTPEQNYRKEKPTVIEFNYIWKVKFGNHNTNWPTVNVIAKNSVDAIDKACVHFCDIATGYSILQAQKMVIGLSRGEKVII